MSERIQRTVYLETTLTPEDVRTAFAQCGEIRGIYAAGNQGSPSNVRYFMEFREHKAAKTARTLRIADVVVHALDSSPHLVDQFRSVAAPGLPQKPHAEVLQSARWAPYSKKKTKHLNPAKDKNRTATYTIIEPAIAMSRTSYAMAPEPFIPALADSFDKENLLLMGPALHYRDHAVEPHLNTGGPGFPPAYMHTDDPSSSSSLSGFTESTCSSSDSTLFINHGLPSVSTSGPALEFDPSLPMAHGWDRAHINLDTLGQSPEQAIGILKMIASNPLECAQWIIVGAHFRSQGNAVAAIAVVTTMIEVMLAVGMDVSQLRPAVLMLSSCHLDVARQLRTANGAETTESQFHVNKACEGFRQVYGSYTPPPSNVPETRLPATPISAPVGATALSDLNANAASDTSVKPTTEGNGALCPSSPTSSPATPKPASRTAEPGTPETRTPVACKASPSGVRHGQVRMLEREIQSLRDKQQKHQESLQRARGAKRKLEDELEREHRRRRKLEGQLGKAEQLAAGAQRGEEYALEQCRAEIETRRRAEDRVEELRNEIAAIEPKVAECEERDRKTREYFGKLGVAFLKAARGDMIEALPAVKM